MTLPRWTLPSEKRNSCFTLGKTEWPANDQRMTSETNRNNTCHYQDIGEQWRFRRTTEKDHRSFIKWPTCHPRSHRTAIDCAPREGSQQPAGVPWYTGQEGRWGKTFSYSRLCNYCNLQWIHWERTRNWWFYRCKYYSTCPQGHASIIRKYFIISGRYRKCNNYAQIDKHRKTFWHGQIADYHSYNVKVAELLESLVSVVM